MTASRNVRIRVDDYVLGRPSTHRHQSFQYYAPISHCLLTAVRTPFHDPETTAHLYWKNQSTSDVLPAVTTHRADKTRTLMAHNGSFYACK